MKTARSKSKPKTVYTIKLYSLATGGWLWSPARTLPAPTIYSTRDAAILGAKDSARRDAGDSIEIRIDVQYWTHHDSLMDIFYEDLEQDDDESLLSEGEQMELAKARAESLAE